jgi:hypothetical protein
MQFEHKEIRSMRVLINRTGAQMRIFVFKRAYRHITATVLMNSHKLISVQKYTSIYYVNEIY